METLKTFVHNYRGFGNCKSRCRVHIKEVTNPRYGDTTFVCFEDMGEGTSVTNFSEELATQMVRNLGLDPEKTRFFESYLNDDGKVRSLDEIKYHWDDGRAHTPNWTHNEFDLKHVFGYE